MKESCLQPYLSTTSSTKKALCQECLGVVLISVFKHIHRLYLLIIDEACLLLQRAMWVDAYNLEADPEEPGQDNRSMRHAGYRSFIFWRHGTFRGRP